MRSELLIDLVHEFWTDTDELLDVKRKQLAQSNEQYMAKWPSLKDEVRLLDLGRTYVDLLLMYVFYPYYLRNFQGIPIEYDGGTLKIVSETVRQERVLKRAMKGVTEIEFVFAHRSSIDFINDIVSHYFHRYPPSEGLVIKWLIINRGFSAPQQWYNNAVREYLQYQTRSLASLTMEEFKRIVDTKPGGYSHTETTALFLQDIYNIPLDPNAPPPESTWEFAKPIPPALQDSYATEHGLEIVDMSMEIVDLTIFQSFPLYYLKKHRIIPLRVEDNHLIVAIVDLGIEEELEEIKMSFKRPIKLKLIRESDFYRVFYNLVNHFLKF